MKLHIVALTTLHLIIGSSIHSAEVRTWSDNTGEFTVEAEYVSQIAGLVTLKKTDGEILRVSTGKLSDEDREFLKSLLPAKPASAGHNSSPKTAERRTSAAKKSLDLLAERLKKRGLSHPSGNTGKCVVYATAGLAFLSGGDKYERHARSCYEYLEANIMGKNGRSAIANSPTWDQTTWSYSHALLFFAEYHERVGGRGSAKKLCSKIAAELTGRQGKNGGWCHGAKGPNALGYHEFVAATNMALIGLGAASQIGIEIDAGVFKKGFEYIENSSNKRDGGVGYSPNRGQKGFGAAGRNAGAILAMIASDQRKSSYRDYSSYMMDNLGKVESGHGSAQLHQLLACWTCHCLGDRESEKFWKLFLEPILARQDKEGNFGLPKGDAAAAAGRARGAGVEGGDRAIATHALMLLIPEGNLKTISSGKG